jgi:hypothetical protein
MCTPRVTRVLISAEKAGIPGVVVTAPGFHDQALITGYNAGVPALRGAIYPGAFSSYSDADLKANTEKIVFPQILELLTKPISAEEVKAVAKIAKEAVPDPKEIVCTGTLQEINETFADLKWTEGLAIIPPTVDAVEEFMKYTALPPNQEFAIMPVVRGRATPWKVAVAGVMAGCRPEYMPVLIAALKAMSPAVFTRTDLESTHSWNPFVVINGPIARQLDIDCGQGLITHSVNHVIGYALELMVRNISGLRIKETRMGTFGYPLPYVLAEDEEFLKNIGWNPHHVEKGFEKNVSTVSMGTSTVWGQNVIPSTSDSRLVMQVIARDVAYKAVFSSSTLNSSRIIMITNPVAQVLASGGYTKPTLISDLIKHARVPTYEYTYIQVYGNAGASFESFDEQLARNMKAKDAEKGKLPEWYGRFPGWEEVVTTPAMTQTPDPAYVSRILVCGDPFRNKTQTLAGTFNFSPVKVELPANWDELMAKRGYKPLSSYYL